MDRYKNQYRIESARLKEYDYSKPGLYFITICTFKHESVFGEIKDGVMHFSSIGEIIRDEWDKSFKIRKELFCDEYIIMPNHIHAILTIENPIGWNVETSGRTSLLSYHPYLRSKSISSFVCGFKSAATKRINQIKNSPKSPVWQTRYHDHIIRDNVDYQRIKQYIRNNIVNYNAGK